MQNVTVIMLRRRHVQLNRVFVFLSESETGVYKSVFLSRSGYSGTGSFYPVRINCCKLFPLKSRSMLMERHPYAPAACTDGSVEASIADV